MGNADSEKGRLRRNPEINSYIRCMLNSATSAVFLTLIKNKTCIYFVIFASTTGRDGFTHASHANSLVPQLLSDWVFSK